MSKKIIIIGSGYGGLASACIFSEAGYEVTVLEKNSHHGGRAGLLEVTQNSDGKWIETSPNNDPSLNDHSDQIFRFDTGPSWYLMPDIFEHFFNLLGEDVEKHLQLKRLSPSYQVIFKDTLLGATKIYGDIEKDSETFEAFEPRARKTLEEYIENSKYKYEQAMSKFLYKNYNSIFDFFTPQMMKEGLKLNVLSNMQKYVSKYFTSTQIQKILLYQLVFLGSSPKNAPALYSLMSHVDFNQGVYYPMGGIDSLTKSIVAMAENRGVKLLTNHNVEKITTENGRANGVIANGKEFPADIVISGADIHFTETKLLDKEHRAYSKRYWKRRTLAPSALLLYLGVKDNYPNLDHHNLVFSKDWDKNFKQLFKPKSFPTDPSFYVCNPNKTDPDVAPKNHENLFVLVPIAAGVKYDEQQLNSYIDKILETMETSLHLKNLRENIVYQKSYCVKDFETDYNSYRGTALGLAHTLNQTAIFRPANQHKKIPNLLFAGGNTVPGIGLPMCLISAELAYKRVVQNSSSEPLKNL